MTLDLSTTLCVLIVVDADRRLCYPNKYSSAVQMVKQWRAPLQKKRRTRRHFSWTAIEHVLCWCISKLFLELKSFKEGHSDRLDTWPRWPGFRSACVLADCFIVLLCRKIRHGKKNEVSFDNFTDLFSLLQPTPFMYFLFHTLLPTFVWFDLLLVACPARMLT